MSDRLLDLAAEGVWSIEGAVCYDCPALEISGCVSLRDKYRRTNRSRDALEWFMYVVHRGHSGDWAEVLYFPGGEAKALLMICERVAQLLEEGGTVMTEEIIQTGYENVLSFDVDLPMGLRFLGPGHWFKLSVGETEIGPINPERVTVMKEPYSVHVQLILTPEEVRQYHDEQRRLRHAALVQYLFTMTPRLVEENEFSEEE